MPLPTQKTPAQARMGKVFIYGEPKVAGKSTLSMTLDPDRTIAFDVEDGLGAIEGYKHRITSWGAVAGFEGEGRARRPVFDEHSFRGLTRMLFEERESHPFKVAVVDTVDALSQLCQDYVLQQLGGGQAPEGYVHASDFDFGKGWSAITDEWSLRIAALARVMESVILISHADRKTEKERNGAEYGVYTPSLGPKGLRNWTLGFVDHIIFARVEENENGELVRVARTRPGKGWEAGGRTVAGGASMPDPIWLPDAATAGLELRKALEAVSAPPQIVPMGPSDELDNDAEPAPKPAAKKAAAKKKPAAQSEPDPRADHNSDGHGGQGQLA